MIYDLNTFAVKNKQNRTSNFFNIVHAESNVNCRFSYYVYFCLQKKNVLKKEIKCCVLLMTVCSL